MHVTYLPFEAAEDQGFSCHDLWWLAEKAAINGEEDPHVYFDIPDLALLSHGG